MEIALNPLKAAQVNALLDSGLWGKTPRQVLTRIVDAAFMDMQTKGIIQ